MLPEDFDSIVEHIKELYMKALRDPDTGSEEALWALNQLSGIYNANWTDSRNEISALRSALAGTHASGNHSIARARKVAESIVRKAQHDAEEERRLYYRRIRHIRRTEQEFLESVRCGNEDFSSLARNLAEENALIRGSIEDAEITIDPAGKADQK